MQRLAAILLVVTAAVTLTTCRGAESTAPVVPASVASFSGNFQTGVVGHILAQPLSVLVTASGGAGAPNVPVQWTVTAGGGSLSATTVATDSLGRASVTLTLGPIAGVLDDTVTATVSGLTPVVFVAGATADIPAQIVTVSGDAQHAAVGQALPLPLVVEARDQFGNPTAGTSIAWSVTAGGGHVSAPVTTTDALGRASVTWTVGTGAGAGRDSVTASAPGLSGSPRRFGASADPGPLASLARVSGDGQTATVAQTLTDSLVVVARDQFGNGVGGIAVQWATAAGDGSVSQTSVPTGANGQAAVRWTLGTTAGAQHASASVSGVAGSPVSFEATALLAEPAQLAFAQQPTGTAAGAAITPAVQVNARDAFGNTVTGFTGDITVAIAANPGGGTLSGTLTVAAVGGEATFNDLSIEKAGAGYTLMASAATLVSASSAPFDITAGTIFGPGSTIGSSPGSITASNGTSVSTITVTAKDVLGNPIPGATVVLAGSGSGITLIQPGAPTNASGIATGSLSATAVGSKIVSATINGVVITPTATVLVTPAGAAVLVFTGQPANTDAGVAINGGSGGVVVTARDPFGNTATGFGGDITMAIGTNPGGGTLGGTTTVSAVAGVAAFSTLNIDLPGSGYRLVASTSGLPNVSSATFNIVSPASGSVVVAAGNGQTGLSGFALNVAPAVLVRDAANAPLANAQVTFAITGGGGSVSGASVTTGADGIATLGSWTVQLGANTLTATVTGGGFTGNPAGFTATGVNGAYHVDVRFLTAMSPARQAVFTNAAQRWESLIYGDVPNIALNVPAGVCGANAPALNETIDDIVIFATVDSIDGPGKVLGAAGPCLIRSSGKLTVAGAMTFDSADVAQLEQSGRFDEVILHEMGHVLGYGTLWSSLSLLVGGGGPDPHLNGAQAIAAFDRTGGQGYSAGAKVPVENCVGFPPGVCGSGTKDAHWRESVFANELMTGFIDAGANPLSVVSTASMGDLGYTVNYAASDPYIVTNPVAAAQGRPLPALELKDDILRIPVFEVDAAGRVVGVRQPR